MFKVISLFLGFNFIMPALADSTGQSPCPESAHLGSESITNESIPKQKKHYCDAAKVNEKASSKNKIVAAVYGIAGGACALECAGQMLGMTQKLCPMTSVAAGVTDVVASKQIAGLLSSMLQVPSLIKVFKPGGTNGAASHAGSKSGKIMACAQAAMNFVTMAMKFKSAKESLKDRDALLAEAAKFPDTEKAKINQATFAGAGAGAGAVKPTQPQSSGEIVSTPNVDSYLPASSLVGDRSIRLIRDPNETNVSGSQGARDIDCYQAHCIRSENPDLPSELTSPEFIETSEQLSGRPFDQLLRSIHSPSDVFGSSGLGSLSGNLANNSNAKLLTEEMKQFLTQDPFFADPNLASGGSIYANGDGTSNQSSSRAESNSGGFGELQDWLNRLGEGVDGSGRGSEIIRTISKESETDFDTQFKNQKVSLFDRISKRITKLSISKEFFREVVEQRGSGQKESGF